MELRINLSENKEKEKLIIDFIKRKTVDGGAQGVKQLLYMIAIGDYIYNNGQNIMPLQAVQPHQVVQQYNNIVTCETQEDEEKKKQEEKEKDIKAFSGFMNGLDF